MLGLYSDGIGGMIDIATLFADDGDTGKIVDPDFAYADYADVKELGKGARGVGLPTCSMHYTHFSASQREAARSICPGASADVLIRVPVNDTYIGNLVWHTFRANMYWPSGEQGKESGNQVLDILFAFKELAQVE